MACMQFLDLTHHQFIPFGSSLCRNCQGVINNSMNVTEPSTETVQLQSSRRQSFVQAGQDIHLLTQFELQSSQPETSGTVSSSTPSTGPAPCSQLGSAGYQPSPPPWTTTYNGVMDRLALNAVTSRQCKLTGQLMKSLTSVSSSRMYQLLQLLKQDARILCSNIAPGQSDELFKLAFPSASMHQRDPSTDQLLTHWKEAYLNAQTPAERKQILSIITKAFKFSDVGEIVPISAYKFIQSRKYVPEPQMKGPVIQCRLDKAKLAHFVQYSKVFHQDVAFGTVSVKLTTGEKLEMPHVVRTGTYTRFGVNYLMFSR